MGIIRNEDPIHLQGAKANSQQEPVDEFIGEVELEELCPTCDQPIPYEYDTCYWRFT